jgi:hypothetical protein
MSSLLGGIGGAIGNAIAGVFFAFLEIKYAEPQNYVLGFILLQLFYLPISFCFYRGMKNSAKDILETRKMLSERANISAQNSLDSF